MASLFPDGPTPPKLKAITLNGAIVVESAEDAKKREERRKQRKSRWEVRTDMYQTPNIYRYACWHIRRPVGRGWAELARAHPTFGGNRVKYTAVPTQLLEEKGTEKDTIYVPTQL